MKPAISTIDNALKAVAREIAMRANVYPKWIAANRMSRDKAEAEQIAMREARECLEYLRTISAGSLPDDARKLVGELRGKCSCVENNPLIRGAMSTEGRLGQCLPCRSAAMIEALSLTGAK